MTSERASQRAFFGVSALLFAASAAATIVCCASMSAVGEMPMPGGWTMSMAWMRMPGQTWPGAAASFLGMWVVMMVAMMLPSLVPTLWRYRQAVGRTGETRRGRLTAPGDGLRFVFRNFPLSEVHPHAEHAAEIAKAAGTHHKFWEMHDMLYAHQHALDDQHLAEYATLLGVPTSEVKCALAQHVYLDRVREHFLSGVRGGVGTPAFFINGLRHDGSYERAELLAAIADAAR